MAVASAVAPTAKATARVIRAGEVAGALAAIIGVVLLVGDRLPFGRSSDPPAPRTLAVGISGVTPDHPVTYGRYLRSIGKLDAFRAQTRRQGLPEEAIEARLALPGIEIGFDLRITGPPGRRLRLTPRLYRQRGRITGKATPMAAVETQDYRSEAWHDRGAASTWVAYPLGPGRYYVELLVEELRGGNRDFVARKRTPVLEIAK